LKPETVAKVYARLGLTATKRFGTIGHWNAELVASHGGHREAQLMIRHPNNPGLQMDQISRLYTPA
jgi:hypothetical protein